MGGTNVIWIAWAKANSVLELHVCYAFGGCEAEEQPISEQHSAKKAASVKDHPLPPGGREQDTGMLWKL
jgi:hypothetical protein